MALDTVVSAVADPPVDDDPAPSPRPQHGLVRWGASRWSWYDDTAAARMHGAARQAGPATPRAVRSPAA
jgi:hypothetical protein